MKRLTYVEIDLEICALSYGVSPCTASIPDTGPTQCYNSRKTCQDIANYDGSSTLTIRFGVDTGYLPDDIDCIPSLLGYSYAPSSISLGEDIGQRASLSVQFKDHPDSDVRFDQYLSSRGLDGYASGTFWGKFRARFPFLQGRPIRLIRGELGQAIEDMDARHFVIESFDGLKPDGTFSIVAKDVLKLLDDDRAQCPLVSNGFLTGAIDEDDTSASMGPTGIGDAEYPSSGYVNIGGTEIVAFTRSGNGLTLTRGQFNTEPVAHEAGERCQLCKVWSAETPDVILHDLFTNYAGMPSSYINQEAWNTEVVNNLNQSYTAVIAEPTSVKKLATELLLMAALAIWDDFHGNLRIRVLRGVTPSGVSLTEENVMGSMKITEQPNSRLSQIWTYFAPLNPLVSIDESFNYRSIAALIDPDAEAAYGSPRIKKVHSRWIPFGGRTIAERFNALHLSQYKDPPRKFAFSLFHDQPISLGEARQIEWKSMQDATGTRLPTTAIITKVTPREDRFEVEALENLYAALDPVDLLNRVIIIDFNSTAINLRSIHDTLFPTPTDQDVIDGVNLVCYIESGVVVNTTDTSTPAFNVGDWPSGFPVTVVVRGSIRGAGGRGGNASIAGGNRNGLPGGLAFYARFPVLLHMDGGFILGGGGGAGAGVSGQSNSSAHDGGGGGQGDPGGLGGNRAGSSGSAFPGSPGSPDGPGAGGPVNGGMGGAWGQPGNQGFGSGGAGNTSGGAAGPAIDGDSFVTETGTGTITGPRIN